MYACDDPAQVRRAAIEVIFFGTFLGTGGGILRGIVLNLFKIGGNSINKILKRCFFSFNGWGVLGSMATIGKNQGVNILLNMFFGPAVNAARGLANQVYVNVYQFVQNYVLAFNPHIVKSYAAGERSAMM